MFGLLGHNGAGKTTLINQIIGISAPTGGSILLRGDNLVDEPAIARRLCSMQPQSHAPLSGLTPRQAVQLMARIRGANAREAADETASIMGLLQIEEWADTISDSLSGGVRRLTSFCMAAVRPGELLMLDEPTNDVDPVRRRLLWTAIKDYAARGTAVLLVTHNVAEAERAVDRLVILNSGRVIAKGTPSALRGDSADQFKLEMLTLNRQSAMDLRDEWSNFGAMAAGSRVVVPIQRTQISDAVARAEKTSSDGWIEEFSILPTSLEDVYIRLTNEETDGEDDVSP